MISCLTNKPKRKRNSNHIPTKGWSSLVVCALKRVLLDDQLSTHFSPLCWRKRWNNSTRTENLQSFTALGHHQRHQCRKRWWQMVVGLHGLLCSAVQTETDVKSSFLMYNAEVDNKQNFCKVVHVSNATMRDRTFSFQLKYAYSVR